MNRKAKIVLIAGIVLYLAGGTLKTFKPELSGIVWTSSLVVLNCFFIPIHLVNRFEEPDFKYKKLYYIAAVLTFIPLSIGDVLNKMNYEISNILVGVGGILLFIGYLPLTIILFRTDLERRGKYKNRLIIGGLLFLVLFLLFGLTYWSLSTGLPD